MTGGKAQVARILSFFSFLAQNKINPDENLKNFCSEDRNDRNCLMCPLCWPWLKWNVNKLVDVQHHACESFIPVYQIHKTIAASQLTNYSNRCFHRCTERPGEKMTAHSRHLACSSSAVECCPFDTAEWIGIRFGNHFSYTEIT